MIIPFFIPHAGCPHQCVFCNQKRITGESGPPSLNSVVQKIDEYIRLSEDVHDVEVAFYGGSFTALPRNMQAAYLSAVAPFVSSGLVKGVRVSTRPDCINEETIELLKAYHVNTVELGVQSMDDKVLLASGRGHRSEDAVRAAGLLRQAGFSVGIQLMAGLPADSARTFEETVRKTIALRPDFARLYPLLVIEDTPLAELYSKGLYTPLTLAEAVDMLKSARKMLESSGINVIRIGLQPSDELMRPGTIIAGPFHPAIGELVSSALLYDEMQTLLRSSGNMSEAVILVNPKDLSAAIGRGRSNIIDLKTRFGLRHLQIIPDTRIKRSCVAIGRIR